MDHLMIISTRLSVTYPPSNCGVVDRRRLQKKVEVCHVTEGFETSKRLIGRTPCTTSWNRGLRWMQWCSFWHPKNVFWKGSNEKCGGVMCWFGLVTCCEVVSLKKCHVVPANCTVTNDSATPMAYDVNSGRKQLFQPQYIAVRQWECKRCSLLFTDNWKSFWVSRSMHKLWMRICIEHPSAGDIVSVSESERHF